MKLTFDFNKLGPILIAAAFVVLSLIAYFFCAPLIQQINKDQQLLNTFKNETIELKKILTASEQNPSKIKLTELSKIDEVSSQIEKIGQKNNITIDYKELPVEDPNSTSQLYKRMIFTIQTTGTYTNVGHFLSELRSMPGVFIDIDQLLISADLSDPTKISVHLNLVLYFSN